MILKQKHQTLLMCTGILEKEKETIGKEIIDGILDGIIEVENFQVEIEIEIEIETGIDT